MPPGDNDTGWQNPAHLTCHPHAANSQSPSSLEDPNHNTSNSGPRGWHMACSFQDPQSALWDFVVRFDFSLASSGRGAALLRSGCHCHCRGTPWGESVPPAEFSLPVKRIPHTIRIRKRAGSLLGTGSFRLISRQRMPVVGQRANGQERGRAEVPRVGCAAAGSSASAAPPPQTRNTRPAPARLENARPGSKPVLGITAPSWCQTFAYHMALA